MSDTTPPDFRSYHEERDARDRQILRAILAGLALCGKNAASQNDDTAVNSAIYQADRLLKDLGL